MMKRETSISSRKAMMTEIMRRCTASRREEREMERNRNRDSESKKERQKGGGNNRNKAKTGGGDRGDIAKCKKGGHISKLT